MSIKLDQCNPKLKERILSQLHGENPVSVITQTAASFVATMTKTTDEKKLNKTEAAYLEYLRMLNTKWIGIQNITLKLADDTRLTVDFVYINNDGRMVFVDTKGGFWREDAKIKIKVAARQFPMFTFVVAHKEKDGWREEIIKS